MIKIPRKITPDRIRESIFEIRFTSHYPKEAILGVFYQAIEKLPEQFGYEYSVIEKNKRLPSFYNEKIKIGVGSSTLIFGCKEGYIGWTAFRKEVLTVVEALAATNVIDSFDRVSIRFISDYENIDLTGNTLFNFTFGFPDIKSDHVELVTHFQTDAFLVYLRLSNNMPYEKPDSSETRISTIDVDVIKNLENITSVSDVFENADQAHIKQKELFFGMLTSDFLNTLNPEY